MFSSPRQRRRSSHSPDIDSESQEQQTIGGEGRGEGESFGGPLTPTLSPATVSKLKTTPTAGERGQNRRDAAISVSTSFLKFVRPGWRR